MSGLNPQQREAIHYLDGPLLVLAGAGSGKTRVITQKIAYLIREGGFSARNIAAITFTNKAAREMQTRVGAMLPVNPRMMWIGTFHGLAHRLLRLHHRDAGLPATFTILDSQDQLAAIKRLLVGNARDEGLDSAGRLLVAPELRQFAQRWLQHVLHIKARLVARPQPACRRAQTPVAIFALHHVPGLRQRARQAQHRGLVQTAAPAQLGQRQARFPQPKSVQQLQCPGDGNHAAIGCGRARCRGWLGLGRRQGGRLGARGGC